MSRYEVDVRVGHKSEPGRTSPRTEQVLNVSSEREAREEVKGRMENMGYDVIQISKVRKIS